MAKFCEDDMWYRGMVECIAVDLVSVFFIDYGNRQMTPAAHVLPLSAKLAKIPAQAVRCCVSKLAEPLEDLKYNSIEFRVDKAIPGIVGKLNNNLELTWLISV